MLYVIFNINTLIHDFIMTKTHLKQQQQILRLIAEENKYMDVNILKYTRLH